jgi:predicted dehydrogenase
MTRDPIGVGIIGLSARGGWAATAHVPALRALDGYELRGVAASSRDSAAAAGEKHGVPLRFAGAAELVSHEAIDLVVVAVKVPQHLELVRSAITAGKMVYSEWPLGRDLAEANEMAKLAAAHRLRTAVGLQARAAPAFRYLKDLVEDGYVGKVLSTSLVASGVNWGATFRPGGDYMLDRANGATMLTVPLGHTVDLVTMVLGEFSQLTATVASLRTRSRSRETGKLKPTNVEDQVALSGTLTSDAVASVHFRGGTSRATNFLWEINGTDGDLLVTLDAPHIVQFARATLRGGRTEEKTVSELPVPSGYERVPALAGRQHDRAYTLAHAYEQLHRDITEDTDLTPDFEHALRRHRLLDQIQRFATQRDPLP